MGWILPMQLEGYRCGMLCYGSASSSGSKRIRTINFRLRATDGWGNAAR